MPGAMPFLHRWWGNPMFSVMARTWFDAKSIHDVYCGLRGFSKELYHRLNQRCTGMEFATEMIIKASLFGEKIAEVPITLHPDGRKSHAPHLKTFRDGWRTLRFFLMYCPRWLFLLPGVLLILIGLIGYGLALPGARFGGVAFDAHTLLFASLAILCGYQSILFAVFTKTFAISEGLMPEDPQLSRLFELINLERGLIISVITIVCGIALALGGGKSMADRELWSTRLCQNHAIGCAGCYTHGFGLSNNPVEFLCQHFGNASKVRDEKRFIGRKFSV